MAWWQRLLVTVVVMLVASFLMGLAWQELLGARLPSYVGGVIGGLAAIPAWEFLKRVRPKV